MKQLNKHNFMAELITTYELRDQRIPIPLDREEFYREQIGVYKKTGRPSRVCAVVNLILFSPDGEIILQKRSSEKKHNPGLLDKAIGGHVSYGDSPFYTLIVETIQELRVPSIVLQTPEEFKKTYKLLKSYLEHIAIVKLLDQGIFELKKVFKDPQEEIVIADQVYLFIGVYGGSTKPVDKEASGVLYYNLETLKKEIKESPQNFTSDILFYFDKYSEQINYFLQELK
jgi:isopentenyldiphosphate isomerase